MKAANTRERGDDRQPRTKSRRPRPWVVMVTYTPKFSFLRRGKETRRLGRYRTEAEATAAMESAMRRYRPLYEKAWVEKIG